MPLSSYFLKSRPELKMRHSEQLGMHWHGPVGAGLTSVETAHTSIEQHLRRGTLQPSAQLKSDPVLESHIATKF